MDAGKAQRFLQFFHGELNRLFFDGKLEAAIISVKHTDTEQQDITASFVDGFDPVIIWFNKCYIEEECDYCTDDMMFLLTILLHEMFHQKNHQDGITDMTEGEHNSNFKNSVYGIMNLNGYGLEDSTSEIILQRLTQYLRTFNAVEKAESYSIDEWDEIMEKVRG